MMDTDEPSENKGHSQKYISEAQSKILVTL